MKADLHIHSRHSHDAVARPESILVMAAERGIDIIAITDHDTTDGWRDFKELESKYPVSVVYGQEIKIFRDHEPVGEVLGLFLHKPVKSHSINQVIAEIRAQGGLISIAHPFSERRGEFRAFADIEDWQDLAVEVMNGRSYKRRDNEMAKSLAERLKTPITAGSDAHTPFEVGHVYLEFEGRSTRDLKKAILNRDVRVGGQPSNVLFSLLSGFGRLGLAL